MKRALDILTPLPIEGSKKFLMPRSKGLGNNKIEKILYKREDEKYPRDGSGRVSPILSMPDVHKQTMLSYVGLQLFTYILDNRLSSTFIKKYKSGEIQNQKIPPFGDKETDDALNFFAKILDLDKEKISQVEDGQPFRLDLFDNISKIMEDPDDTLIQNLKMGVHMGEKS